MTLLMSSAVSGNPFRIGNIGYVLLAILIDEVSGKTLRERLLTTMFKEP